MPTPNPEQIVEKIDEVGGTGSSAFSGFVAEPETRMPPSKEHFDSFYVQEAEPVTNVRKVETERISLMDEISGINKQVNTMKIAPPEQLVAQVDEAVGKIRSLRAKLEAPGAAIKPEWQTTLRNQLTHIDDTLKITLNKAGVEYKVPDVAEAPKNPIERFLGLLENGQKQMEALGGEVSKFQNAASLAPQDMLGMQYKVNLVQQQLELFTSLLNKALESTKTVMNTQV